MKKHNGQNNPATIQIKHKPIKEATTTNIWNILSHNPTMHNNIHPHNKWDALPNNNNINPCIHKIPTRNDKTKKNKMNPKIEKWMKNKIDKAIDFSGAIVNNLALRKIKEVIWTEEQLYKFKEASLKGIKIVFHIMFGVSISLTFLLFFPIILKMQLVYMT